MVDRPVCKLCGERHWSYEQHRFSDKPEHPELSHNLTGKQVVYNKRYRAKHLDWYRNYMRDYMRAKRQGKGLSGDKTGKAGTSVS